MDIVLNCPGCGKTYTLDDALTGRRVRCKGCTTIFEIAAAPVPLASDDLELLPEPAPSRTAGGRDRWWRDGRIVAGSGAVAALATIAMVVLLVVRPPAEKPADPRAIAVVEMPAPPEPIAAKPGPKPAPEPAPKPEPPAVVKAEPKPAEELARDLQTSEVVARCEPSVALIRGKRSVGTGFLVAPGILATNAHVIDGEIVQNIEVRFPSAEGAARGPFPARLLHQDKVKDLAFLAVASDLPPLTIAPAHAFRKGEDVVVIGNPGVGGKVVIENAISRGVVSSKHTIAGQDYLQLGVAINPGNSGGPVIDVKGRVIGVATLKTSQQEGLAFCIPAEGLLASLAVAKGKATADAVAAKANPKGTAAPSLSYGWKVGEVYVYAVKVAITAPGGDIRLEGASRLRVKSVEGRGVTLTHSAWMVTKRGSKGVTSEVTGPHLINAYDLTLDRKGKVIDATGSSPLPMLGDFATLMIEPLPDGPEASWEDTRSIALSDAGSEPSGGVGGPSVRFGRPTLGSQARGSASRLSPRGVQPGLRGRSAPMPSRPGSRLRRQSMLVPDPEPDKPGALTAREQTTYTLGDASGDTIVIEKDYDLATTEAVDGQPRLAMTGDGTITFDLKAGLPVAMEFRAKVVETTENLTLRVPITVTCRLLTGAERDQAMNAPPLTPTPMDPITDAQVTGAISGTSHPDTPKAIAAAARLARSAPIEPRRAEVARALEARGRETRDHGLKVEIIKALGVWGDRESARVIVGWITDESFGMRGELFDTLARIPADGATIDALAPWLSRDPGLYGRMARGMGPAAEDALIRIVERTDADPRARIEAMRLLEAVATSKSIPALTAIMRLKDAVEVGRSAKEAREVIGRRWPRDDQWDALLLDAKSSDDNTRRSVARRLMEIEPVAARRDECARILETLLDDSRAFEDAIHALGNWGDARSATILTKRLDTVDVRYIQIVVEAILKIGPGEGFDDMLNRVAKRGSRWFGDLSGSVGPRLEGPAIRIIDDPATDADWGMKRDFCGLLARLGTSASLPALEAAIARTKTGFIADAARDAIRAISLRSRPDGGFPALIADLAGRDNRARVAALERLSLTPPAPDNPRRAEIARALDLLLDEPHDRAVLMKAVGLWGDAKSAEAITDRLDKNDLWGRDDALHALVKLRPDDRTIKTALRHVERHAESVCKALRPLGASAEPTLLAMAKAGETTKIRCGACRVLCSLGTPKALPDLEALTRAGVGEDLARQAEGTLRAIASRSQ